MKLDQKIKLDILENPLIISEENKRQGSPPMGLVIVDEVNGFVTPGAGALAPPVLDPVIEKMVDKTNEMAKDFIDKGHKVLVLNECHEPGVEEIPYPPHCERGSGEELLPPKLEWLYKHKAVTTVHKNCINGFIGGMRKDGTNAIVDWMNKNKIKALVVVGICTDICVMQFVQSMLSARNMVYPDNTKMMGNFMLFVCTDASATYDLPLEVVETIDEMPKTAAHPRDITNYMGLYFMQASGAILIKEVTTIEKLKKKRNKK